MKQHPVAFLLFISVCLTAPSSDGHELALYGTLPELDNEWKLQEQGSEQDGRYQYAWATFISSKSGDVLSFVADKYQNVDRNVGDDAVRQSATDMFPGGYPRGFMRIPTQPTEPSKWIISDVLRSSIVKFEEKVDVLECSYVYEDRTNTVPKRLAHGYAVAFRDTVVFVQHTSSQVIDSIRLRKKSTVGLRVCRRAHARTEGRSN